ncbi:hypothetical protein DCO58_06525 [Helicobacter saguini]|uniref:Lipid/polyisoprenoid-binding YceI-like domain-containing protein n=2 Tax=Helicobacter saguini TaxID=1548018 RepID=A0A347VTQ3_9HELI|nr:hypothetical protein [Helicobacter saguini]MWV67317.1 hypothetical protein [Helicobacter saguini]MWV69670.1 hypothetical protein [Helicobacter saguini]MWV73113.1 hypothetical protein [Helicobacter saguini]TLD95690.1 hypothetical protein LS64_001260 [Helicobacter saguini]
MFAKEALKSQDSIKSKSQNSKNVESKSKESKNIESKSQNLQEYMLDPTHSSVSFAVKHLSVADTIGVFTDFSGQIFYDKNTRDLRLQGSLDVDSVNSFNVGRDEELRNTDFFIIKNISLESTSKKDNILYAKVSINGITKIVKFNVKITGPIRNPSLDIKDSKDSKSKQNIESKSPVNPLFSTNSNTQNVLINPHFPTQDLSDNKEDCGCYVSFGDNVLGIVLEGRINRFDFNISPTTPRELLGEFVDVKIIIEASN